MMEHRVHQGLMDSQEELVKEDRMVHLVDPVSLVDLDRMVQTDKMDLMGKMEDLDRMVLKADQVCLTDLFIINIVKNNVIVPSHTTNNF